MCNNDKCEKKTEDMSFFLDGYIDETDDDMVVVPRSEYDKLIANSTLMKVVERVIDSDAFSTYSVGTYLKEILAINKPAPEPDIPSASGPDEEASE